eukprot:RCo042703
MHLRSDWVPSVCPSFATNPLDLKSSSRLSLASSPRGIQAADSRASSLCRPITPQSVVVSNIQLTFDPKALPALGNRTPLFATVELSPSLGSMPSRPQHITAEMR